MSRAVGRTARRIGDRLKARGWQLGLVETLTGGAVADRLTDVPGSSAYFAGSVNVPRPDRLAAWLPAGMPAADRDGLAQTAAEWIRAELGVDLGVAVIVATGTDRPGSGPAVEIALAGPGVTGRRSYRPRGTGAVWQAAVGRTVLQTIDRALADPETAPSPR